MKKLFTILAAILVAGSMWGTNVTFTFKTDKDITYTANGQSGGGAACEVSKSNVTLNGSDAYTASTKTLSVYSKATLTVSVPAGNVITSITATYTSGCRPFVEAMPNGVTDETVKLSSACSGTWSGTAAQSVTLTNNAAGKTELTVLVVNYNAVGGGGSTPTALAVPSNLGSSNVTTTGATLSWDAVANASSYTVKIGETEYTGVNTNSYSATGLTAETQYTWTVKAIGDGVNYSTSAYAANANFTTEAEQGGDPEPTPAVLPVVNFNNLGFASWGKDASFSGTDFDEVSQTKDGVTFTYTRNSGSIYGNNSAMRFYKSNELTFDAPTGYKIVAIVFDGSAYKDDVTTDVETCTSTTKALSWVGEATSVTFTRPSNASSYITLTSVAVSLAPVVTIGAAGYSTYCAPFNFTVAGVTVYKAALNNDGTAINLTAVEGIVPANEGVILGGSGNVTIVPTTETASADVDDNELIGTTAAISTPANAYVLKANEAEFAHFTGATIPANKAYLVIPASAPLRMEIVSSNPVATGIENVATVKATMALVNGQLVIVRNGVKFNMNGMLVK